MEQGSKNIPPPAKPPVSAVGGGVQRKLNIRSGYLSSPRSHCISRGPTTPASSYRFEGARPAANRLRRRQAAASKEIVRRALAPPCQRPSLRWRNFRPSPSRFSVVSVAA